MPLPDFIIIGAMKSGTSTLHSNLQSHPEIGMSKSKEPSYFNNRIFNFDIEWYKDQFSNEKKINGESSPNYSKKQLYPKTAERMYQALPNVKLIFLMRDPIDRIISHLHHNLYRGRLMYEDIDANILASDNYILTSNYYYQTQEYLNFYDKDQILFLTTEELKLDLNKTLNKICDFLEVSHFDFSGAYKIRNQSSRKYLIPYYDFVHSNFPAIVRRQYHKIFYLVNIKIPRPQLRQETIEIIKSRLDSDIEELKKLSNNQFEHWHAWNQLPEKNTV